MFKQLSLDKNSNILGLIKKSKEMKLNNLQDLMTDMIGDLK